MHLIILFYDAFNSKIITPNRLFAHISPKSFIHYFLFYRHPLDSQNNAMLRHVFDLEIFQTRYLIACFLDLKDNCLLKDNIFSRKMGKNIKKKKKTLVFCGIVS